jgi:hypothetical protein
MAVGPTRHMRVAVAVPLFAACRGSEAAASATGVEVAIQVVVAETGEGGMGAASAFVVVGAVYSRTAGAAVRAGTESRAAMATAPTRQIRADALLCAACGATAGVDSVRAAGDAAARIGAAGDATGRDVDVETGGEAVGTAGGEGPLAAMATAPTRHICTEAERPLTAGCGASTDRAAEEAAVAC